MKLTQQRSDILDPKPTEQGFIIGKYDDPMMYAAVPICGSDTKLAIVHQGWVCLLYTSPSPRDATLSRMPSSA